MKFVESHNGFKQNQLVVEQGRLARIVYIEIDKPLSEHLERDIHRVRLGLIDNSGHEFANSSTTTDQLRHILNIQDIVKEHKIVRL